MKSKDEDCIDCKDKEWRVKVDISSHSGGTSMSYIVEKIKEGLISTTEITESQANLIGHLLYAHNIKRDVLVYSGLKEHAALLFSLLVDAGIECELDSSKIGVQK